MGDTVDNRLGNTEDGNIDGPTLGEGVGSTDSPATVGVLEGVSELPTADGCRLTDGTCVGSLVGRLLGKSLDGMAVGLQLGTPVGLTVAP